jgi:hypothetical protein
MPKMNPNGRGFESPSGQITIFPIKYISETLDEVKSTAPVVERQSMTIYIDLTSQKRRFYAFVFEWICQRRKKNTKNLEVQILYFTDVCLDYYGFLSEFWALESKSGHNSEIFAHEPLSNWRSWAFLKVFSYWNRSILLKIWGLPWKLLSLQATFDT